MSEVQPLLLSAIICNRVIFDKFTSMPSLIDIVQNINSPQFPARHSQLVFFCEMTDGHGKANTKIRLVNLQEDDKAIFEKEGMVTFEDATQVVTLAVNLQGVVFPSPGEYRFQIFADDVLLGERRIICRKVELRPEDKQGDKQKYK